MSLGFALSPALGVRLDSLPLGFGQPGFGQPGFGQLGFGPIGFGEAALDARLGGGLQAGALHEFYSANPDDGVAAMVLALLLAGRCGRTGPLLWLVEARAMRGVRPYAPGLAALGLNPERLLLVRAPDTMALLRAAADAVACPALAAVVLRCGRAPAFDLTASRRLALAAARSGVSVLAVREGEPTPSAASTRWAVAALPSRALAADAPGSPVFGVELLRCRAGRPGFSMQLEWNGEERSFQTANPGSVAAIAVRGAGSPGSAIAA
jgi:protein ImuA